MARTTSKHVESAFTHFCNTFGFHKADSYKDVGGLRLDHNNIYGGYNIEEIVNEGGGVRHPFGQDRQKAGTMYAMLWFAIRTHEHG